MSREFVVGRCTPIPNSVVVTHHLPVGPHWSSAGSTMKRAQRRIRAWVESTFSYLMPQVMEVKERRMRFYEEANELAQACGMTREEAHRMVDYTWDRPQDTPEKEIGGVMVCTLGLIEALGLDAMDLLEAELVRIEDPDFIEKIHAKHQSKIDAGITS